MIGKISKSGSNFHGAANYNQKKVNAGSAYILDQHKLLGTSPKELDKRFNELSDQSRTRKKVFHVALSFSPEEKAKMTDQNMATLGREYMNKMGYGKQPYIIYRHTDTKHPHIHILSSRVDIDTNKKINDSHEGRKSKRVTDEMERRYGLVISDKQQPNWKSISDKDRAALQEQKKIDLENTPLVKEVKRALKNAPHNAAALNRQLKQNGVDIRVRQTGKGIVYNKVDENDKVISKLRKGSDFKAVGIDRKGLIQTFDKINENLKGLKNLIHKERVPSLFELEKKMAKYGVKPKFSMGKNGINGMSYEYQGINYKASSIDRNLSWGKVKDSFKDASYIELREQLKKSLERGGTLGRKYDRESQRLTYISANDKSLEHNLNNLVDERGRRDDWGAGQLFDKHNEGLKNKKQANAAVEISNYIEERYRDNGKTNQHQLTL